MSLKDIGQIVFFLGVLLCVVAGFAFGGLIAKGSAMPLLVAGIVAIMVGGFLRSGQIGGKQSLEKSEFYSRVKSAVNNYQTKMSGLNAESYDLAFFVGWCATYPVDARIEGKVMNWSNDYEQKS